MTTPLTGAQLLARVHASEFSEACQEWDVSTLPANAAAPDGVLVCRSPVDASWEIHPILTPIALAVAVAAGRAGRTDPDGTRLRTGFAVPDTEIMRATAEAHLAALLRRGCRVWYVGDETVERFPADER